MSDRAGREGCRRSRSALLAGVALTLSLGYGASLEAGEAEEGRRVYHTYCVLCHGPNMVNASTGNTDLRRFPLDQKERFVASVTKGKKGRREMPAWGDLLSEEQLEALWAYVKTRGE